MQPKTFRVLAWLFSLAAFFVLLLLLSAALVFWQPELIKPIIERALTPEGGSASFGRIELSLSPPGITIENLQTTRAQESTIHLAKLRMDLDPNGIWGAGPWIELLEAEGLKIEIATGPKEAPESIDPNELNLILAVRRARVKNSAFNLLSQQGRFGLKVSSLTIEPHKKDQRRFRLACRASWSDPGGEPLAWAAIKAKGSLDMSPRLELDLNIAEGGLALAELQGPLTGSAQLVLDEQQLQIADLALAVAKGKGRLTPALLKLEGQSQLEGKNALVKLHELKLGGHLAASADFSGNLTEELSGELTARGRAGWDGLTVENALLQARLAGDWAAPRVEDLSCQIPEGALLWQGKKMLVGAVKVSGKASLENHDEILLRDLTAEAGQLGTLKASVWLKNGNPQRAAITSDGLRADKLLALFQRLTGQPKEAWQAQGSLNLAAELGQDLPGQWKAALTSKDLGFSSADGAVLVGQLAGQIAAWGNLDSNPIIRTQLKLHSGQALWGTVFLDLAKAPFELNGQARIAAPDDLRQIKFKGQMKDYGRFSGSGELAFSGGVLRHQGNLLLKDLNMTHLFNTFVRDPLSVSQPNLAAWQIKGQAQLEVKGKGKGRQASMKGRMRLKKAALQTGQGTSLQRLDLNLPFTYKLGGGGPAQPAKPGRRSWGKLSIRGLSTPGLELKNLELPVAITPNRLWTLGAVKVPLSGGNIQITNLIVDNPLSPGFKAGFAAQLDKIDLAKLAGPNLPLSGSLTGRLAQVSLTRQRLRAKGRLDGTFYGGALTAKGLAVELPFNPGREIQADITARQIHLEPLSQALKVGRVTGRVDAELNGLRLAYGQPVAFELRVESIEVPGVDQQVSLRAVNSISLLGTGTGLSGVGLGLFASFFKEFPYDKIAFSCKLKNDVFQVRGLIHEDGVEYLVKRPLLMGINVINRNPDNLISFSDMLERLQRVQQDNAPRRSEAEEKEER